MTERTPSVLITTQEPDSLTGALQLAIASTSDGVALLDAESKYIYLNESHIVQFGYEDESELLGKTWHVFYRPVEIERIEREIFPLLMQHGTWRGETVGVKKNGDAIYQEITLTILEDGGMVCLTRILDKLKEVERQLEVRNESIGSIIRNVTAGILLENEHRFIVEANSQLGEMFGVELNPNQVKGTDCTLALEFIKTLVADPDHFIFRINNLLENSVPAYNELIELAGGNRFLERDFIPMIVDGESKGYLWVYRDVTEYQRAKQGLERLVSREQELNEMRSKLVRTVSHEFKKPILSTLTGIQLLQGQLRSNHELIYSKAMDHIVQELQGLNDSVSKLVNYEALYDRTEANMKPVNVKNLIRNYLSYHFKLFLISEKFVITDETGEESVQLDIDLFNLALKNIIENSIKYSSYNDRILINVWTQNGFVHMEFTNPVTDITRPDKNQLGNALYRSNPTDDRGLGLGLGIVQHVIGLLGGQQAYKVDKDNYAITISLPITKA